MKNLANCTIREFAAQTALMADAVENWMKLTDVFNIRRDVPELPPVPKLGEHPTEVELKERERVIKERNQIIKKAALENFFKIVRAAMKDHPEETIEVIAYSCFIPLDKVDDYKMKDILRSVTEMISDEDVLDFFVSLKDLEQKIGT